MKEKIEKIIEEAEKNGFSQFGLRAMIGAEVGADIKNSHQFGDTWDDEELDGTSCIKISYDGFEVNDIDGDLKNLEMYIENGSQIVLVGGSESYEGTDANETVIKNAVCLMIF